MRLQYKIFLILILFVFGCGFLKYNIGGTVGARLAVADIGNNRVLIWNHTPNSFADPADIVLGQPDLVSNTANNTPGSPGTTSAYSLSGPIGVEIIGDKLAVSDQNNHRVLIWNSWPTMNQQPADVVLGQATMSGSAAGTGTATSLSFPNHLSYDGQHLLLGDITGRRIKIWNSIPTTNNQPPDLVLCQSTLLAWALGTTSQLCMRPNSAASNGQKVAVLDWQNHRVLIWNSFPTVNGQAADVVLGQPNMTSSTINNTPGAAGTVSAQSLHFWEAAAQGSGRVMFIGDKLVVGDFNNNRILVWNTVPTQNQQAADLVIGQPDMTTANTNLNLYGFNSPAGFYYGAGRFIVADTVNHRILIWKKFPQSNGEPSDYVLGQNNFLSNSYVPVTGGSLYFPTAVSGNYTSTGVQKPEGY